MGSRKDNTVTGGRCLYWSISTKSCTYGKGGIYLPASEHIQTYCQTSNYLSCPLLEGQIFASSSGGQEDECKDRRFYERVQGRFVFWLSDSIKGENIAPVLDDQSCTVDISPGGVRFETFQEIPVDSLVSFSLAANSNDDPLEGVGLVKWCISRNNTSVFHVGIAFVDTSVPCAVRNRLGLIVN